ncbi:MAG: hypothetical protein EZS28_035412 [Streblomastix strix]|uniref:KilA-N domain-containing protein n=1 Tax=Streblomastix strix TaxID=222440 RepID=A0A5J4UGP2_9EUKA|nr:MAG: hypothetical protein EZS28_035412 [Streblomastix strix]
MKSDYDMKLKKDDNKYIDETIYSDIEGEPQSRHTYDEIQQMRRKQYEMDHKCQLDPSMIVLEVDLIKEAKYKELMDKKCQFDPSMVLLDQDTFKEIIHGQMTQVETATILQNDEQFINASYNGMTILVRQSDGYINATQFCEQYNKRFRRLLITDHWKDYIKAETDELIEQSQNIQITDEKKPASKKAGSLVMYIIDKGYANDLKGYYVHPRLINYIAICISPKYTVTVRKIMDSINENSQQTHTTFEANTSRLVEQLQREITDYDNTIQQMTPRLVPQDKQYDYIYSVELINEDIDGRSTIYINNLPIAVTINHVIKDMLQQRGIIMKNLGFTIPIDQDVDAIMNQIRQTITERTIH